MKEQHTQPTPMEEIQQIRQKAHEHLKEHQWLQALNGFQTLIEQNEQDDDALLGAAGALEALGRYEQLLAVAKNFLHFYPNSAPALAYKARALQKLERFSEATIANDQALLLDTNLPLAWINRSGLQLLQKKFPEALRSAQRAVELAPDDARAWANKGVALLNFQRLVEALEAFDASLACEADFLFSLQMRGEILCKMGRMQDAIANAQQALQTYPTDVPSLTQAATAFRSLEMYSSLRDITRTLIQQAPNSLFAWENHMRGLRGLGDYGEAVEAVNRVLELDPGNVRFWTIKADTLYRLERYREAASVAERAVQLDLDYPPARRIREKAVRMMYQKKERRISKPMRPQS